MMLIPESLAYRLARWRVTHRRPASEWVPGRLLVGLPPTLYPRVAPRLEAWTAYFEEIIPFACSPSETPLPPGMLMLEHVNWTGLPGQATLQRFQALRPEVVLHLDDYHLPADYLIGMLPARVRMGFFDTRAEPFYDMLIQTQNPDIEARLTLIEGYLAHLCPSAERRTV